jgi:Ca2+-binding EF-hand superfamily protein
MISNEELVQIFGHFDGDHDGRINRQEFNGLLSALGVVAPRVELDACFDSIDADGSGSIEFNEFGHWWMSR